MPYIGNTIRAADDYRLIDDISSGFNGSETSFALQVAGSAPVPFPKSPQQVLISVNGVIQEPDPSGSSGFNLVGTNIVFSSAPTNGHAFFGIIYATADYLNAGGNFPAGSLGAPSITFIGDENTGLFRKSGGSVGFVSDATEIANFDSNGITISSGNLIIPDSIIHGGDTNTKIRFPAADTITAETGGSERVRVDSSGNVGIGTASPTTKFHVLDTSKTSTTARDNTIARFLSNASNADCNIQISNGVDHSAQLGIVGNGAEFYIAQDGNERLRIDSAGKVGIGTTNPAEQLVVMGSGDPTIRIQETASGSGKRLDLGVTDSGAVGFIGANQSASKLAFQTVGSERMRIDNNGNVGIGTTTIGNESDHKKLIISGAANTGAGILEFQDTSNNTDGAIFSDDGNLFIVADRDNTTSNSSIRFRVDGSSEKMRIDSSGNVGIALTPSSGQGILQLNGGLRIAGSASASDTSGPFIFRTSGADNMVFATSSNERVRITSNGLVGLNNTSPAGQVHVGAADNSDHEAIIMLNNGGATGQEAGLVWRYESGTTPRAKIHVNSSDQILRFSTANSERMRIGDSSNSGKLFIGTTSGGDDSAKIRAKQGVNVDSSYTDYLHAPYEAQITINSGGQNKQVGILNSWDGNIHATSIATYYDSNGYGMVFAVNDDTNDRPLERAKISREGVASFNSTSHVFNATTSQAAGGSSYYNYRGHHSGGTISFNVWSNGNVQNTNNSYSSISDVKLKENIVDANSQWSDIKALKIRNYNFKAETKHETHTQIGVVAQELETVCPKLVTEIPDVDSDGKDLGTTTKTVNYSVLYMKSIKCLQEAMAKIETLETKVAALEAA